MSHDLEGGSEGGEGGKNGVVVRGFEDLVDTAHHMVPEPGGRADGFGDDLRSRVGQLGSRHPGSEVCQLLLQVRRLC